MTSTAEILQNALQLLNSGKPAKAEIECRAVLELLPHASDALHIMGLCALEQKHYNEAAEWLEKALAADPGEPDAWKHLGMVREAAGQTADAIEAYQRALAGGDTEVELSLSRVLASAGRTDEALAIWQRRLSAQPEDKTVWLAIGKLLLGADRVAEAAAHYRAAVAQQPDFFDAWICLGNTLRGLSQTDDAADAYRKALTLQPGSALCLANLGTTFLDRGEFDQALPWYDRAIAAQPDYAVARVLRCIAELPMFYTTPAAVDQARSRYSEALNALVAHYTQTAPRDLPKLGRVIGHTQPFLLPYQQRNDRELQARYGELICRAANAAYNRFAVSHAHRPRPASNGKLRIAFVGAHFCGHSVWKAITRGWLEQLNRKQYELLGYYTSPKSDSQTVYASRLFHRFVQGPLEAEEWMQRIRADDPHLIVYPEVGMDPMTAKLAAVRLAPVQCIAWGHPETSGYPTLDYYLSGELLDAPDAGAHYTEQLVRLAGTSSHYTPLTVPEARVCRADFGVGDDEVAYLCCQNLFKYLPQYDDVLVRIAQAVPNSRFVFFRHKVADSFSAAFEARLQAAFDAAQVPFATHCRFNAWLDLGSFEAMLRCMDVYLDSIGFSGFNTAIEALGAGLPVVTLEGEFLRGRLASSILRQIEVADTVALSVDEYVDIAAGLGLDRARRDNISGRIKNNLVRAYENKDAVRSLEKFIEYACAGMRSGDDAANAEKLQQRAVRMQQAGQHAEAEALYREVIAIRPDFVQAHGNLGVALMAQGRSDEAIAAYRRALEIDPEFADATYNLARAVFKKGRNDEAIRLFQKAAELYGDTTANALNALGNVLRTINQPQRALPHAQRAVEIEPQNAEAWNNLACTYRDVGRFDDALAAYRRAILADPATPAPRLHLCNVMIPQGYRTAAEVQEARDRYASTLEDLRAHFLVRHPEELAALGRVATTSQPFYLPYQGMNDRELLARHGDLVCRAVAEAYPGFSVSRNHRPKPDAEGKIRIGIVMAFFRAHSVWKAILKGWMAKLDRSRFALYGYHTQSYSDSETAIARGYCRRFVQGPLDTAQWCKKIREDDPHILIYPEIGMDPDSASLATLRLAPVQCATWGHPETSGMPTLDYYLSGELLEPPDGSEHYTERLVRLPGTSACYEPVPFKPSAKGRADFGLGEQDVVFLCCQNPFKYLPQYDEVFPRIAKAVPGSRFVFFRHKKSDGLNALFHERVAAVFTSHGLVFEQHAVFLDWQSFADFQALLSIADVFLDSIGFSGFNTASEALAGSLPVVTLESEFMRGRLAAAILRQIGVTDSIAATVDEYVDTAVSLGVQPERRAELRQRIMRQLPTAYNDLAPVLALERFLAEVSAPLLPPPVWKLLTEEPGSDAQAYNHAYAPKGLIDMVVGAPELVLDVGCFVGVTGALIKQRWPNARVVGIEPNPEAARRAATRVDYVANTTLENVDWPAAGVTPNSVDMVVLADVLEHFYNPWQALLSLKPLLAPGAQVMISLPNVRNLWLADRLMSQGLWRYERAGLLDVTHIRFFTLVEARRMLDETGYRIEATKMNPDHRLQKFFSHKIAEGDTATLTAGRMSISGVTREELAELTALQFFLRCVPEQGGSYL